MSRSNQESIKHRFRWVIDGITRDKLERSGSYLESGLFSIDFNGNMTEWRGLIKQGESGYLFVGITKYKVLRDDFCFDFDVSLNGVKQLGGSKVKSTEVKPNFGRTDFVAFDKLFDATSEYFRIDSKMELVYDIELFQPNIEEDTPSQHSYTKFFNDTTLADFTLISSDENPFKVHRMALADASDYFMKSFTIDMKEKQQGSVKFDDIDSDALKEVLDFIYNNKTGIDNVEKASKVIYAAEMFNISGLKAICCEILKDKLSIENVIEFLSIAHMFNEEQLENLCLKIIIDNYEAVKQSEGWKLLTLPLFTKITDALIADSKIPQTTLYSTR